MLLGCTVFFPVTAMNKTISAALWRIMGIPEYLARWVSEYSAQQGRFTLVITNDPDHGKTDEYVRVFSELNRLGLKVCTGVFCTLENDGSDLARHCHKGETHTLADPAYRDLMVELHGQGHEIVFHGYSQVSNVREKFIEGLEIFRETFGHYPFTYVEHGGNISRHLLGMCKRESLAMEGRNPESPYYVFDVIREKIGCVWTSRDLLDDYAVKHAENLFYWQDGVLFFRRARLHMLDRMISDVARAAGVFVGYTHFGYDGYRKLPRYRFENWTSSHLKAAVGGMGNIINHYDVTNLTVQELVQKSLSGTNERGTVHRKTKE
jgi:hypothetical protein